MLLYGSMVYYMRGVGEFIRISNVRNLMWPLGGAPSITEGHWPNEQQIEFEHLLSLYDPMPHGFISYFHDG